MTSKAIITALTAVLLVSMPVAGQKMKIGSYTFKDGAIYSGELVSGKPNGKGRTVFKNGDTYDGEYV